MTCPRCQKCNNATEKVDGTEIFGGFPGVKYHYCRACGWAKAIPMKRVSIPATNPGAMCKSIVAPTPMRGAKP
jgi:hypothetical protein